MKSCDCWMCTALIFSLSQVSIYLSFSFRRCVRYYINHIKRKQNTQKQETWRYIWNRKKKREKWWRKKHTTKKNFSIWYVRLIAFPISNTWMNFGALNFEDTRITKWLSETRRPTRVKTKIFGLRVYVHAASNNARMLGFLFSLRHTSHTRCCCFFSCSLLLGRIRNVIASNEKTNRYTYTVRWLCVSQRWHIFIDFY